MENLHQPKEPTSRSVLTDALGHQVWQVVQELPTNTTLTELIQWRGQHALPHVKPWADFMSGLNPKEQRCIRKMLFPLARRDLVDVTLSEVTDPQFDVQNSEEGRIKYRGMGEASVHFLKVAFQGADPEELKNPQG